MKCPSCDAENQDDEMFCIACGEQLEELIDSEVCEACDPELLEEIKELEIPKVPIAVRVAGWTDKGLVREFNQDNFKIETWLFPDNKARLDVLIVADGMGGGNYGAEFAYIGVNQVASFIGNFVNTSSISELTEIASIIQPAVQKANEEVLKYRLENNIQGRNEGTTLVMAVILSDLQTGKIICHGWNEGDSRLYLFDSNIKQISKDHTLAGGLNRFLGKHRTIGGDALNLEFWAGEHSEITFLLCTDGFSDMLSPEQIQEYLATNPHPAIAVEELIEKAKSVEKPCEPEAKPGDDNLTVVIWQAKPVFPKEEKKDETRNE